MARSASQHVDQNRQAIPSLRPDTTAVTIVEFDDEASTPTAVFDSSHVELLATSDCFIDLGEEPEAAATSWPLLANQPRIIHVYPTDKISVIQATEAGSLYITECV